MSIYKECDIRGIYPKELNEKNAYEIGRAVGTMMSAKTLAVGGDVRLSTQMLKDNLIKGLRDSGTNVIDIGMVPTPVFYFSLKHLRVDGGITVTASHNPANYNGFKLMFGDSPVTPAVIKHIESIISTGSYSLGSGSMESTDVNGAYIDFTTKSHPGGTLKVVLDCCNGAAGNLAPLIFRVLGYNVIPLYCELDGAFPNRDPNPAVYKNLKDLKDKVIETGADFGAAFDGDGDRIVFVDDKGQVLNSESTLVILIKHYFSQLSDVAFNSDNSITKSVVYDIKSSSIVKNSVSELGGKPIPERSGHAFIKRTFLENRSVLAGEISGHFFFSELGYDDGIYAALKMAEILGDGKKLSDIHSSIPATVITPDIRVYCKYEERDMWLDSVREAGKGYDITLMDGIRVDFPYGWILIRKSVTEEGITIRIEAEDDDHMRMIKKWITEVLPETKPAVAK